MSYRSNWNDLNELKCLLIFKQLQLAGFPRGLQKQLCEEMSKSTHLDSGNISAKICNIKSIAGVNNTSNYSQNTKKIYDTYHNLSIEELKMKINHLQNSS